MELLRHERFAEALQALEGLPLESGMDPDVLLMHAVLRINLRAASRGRGKPVPAS